MFRCSQYTPLCWLPHRLLQLKVKYFSLRVDSNIEDAKLAQDMGPDPVPSQHSLMAKAKRLHDSIHMNMVREIAGENVSQIIPQNDGNGRDSDPTIKDEINTEENADAIASAVNSIINSDAPAVKFSKDVPLFNTYRLVMELQRNGLTRYQASILMEALIVATGKVRTGFESTIATKVDFTSLQTQLEEKVVNASQKYDLQHQFQREILKSECSTLRNDMTSEARTIDASFAAFKSDMRMQLKTDLFAIQQSLIKIDREVSSSRIDFDSEQERLQGRLIRFALGFIASFGALMLTAVRLFGVSVPGAHGKQPANSLELPSGQQQTIDFFHSPALINRPDEDVVSLK